MLQRPSDVVSEALVMGTRLTFSSVQSDAVFGDHPVDISLPRVKCHCSFWVHDCIGPAHAYAKALP